MKNQGGGIMTFAKKAYDLARKQVFFCDAGQPLSEIARQMYSKNIGSIIVKEGNRHIGIITVNDMLRAMNKNKNPDKTPAKDIMSSPLVIANKNLEIDELVDKFNNSKVSRMILVNEKDEVVGVVRDIAVYQYMTFYKYDQEVRKRFSKNYARPLY
ncbi:CBS domain-containing protein [Candidatus Woesearchaeota archaeon]|nr:CBS domain-containing protein [Candidatus Woesearchaeota archaeon]